MRRRRIRAPAAPAPCTVTPSPRAAPTGRQQRSQNYPDRCRRDRRDRNPRRGHGRFRRLSHRQELSRASGRRSRQSGNSFRQCRDLQDPERAAKDLGVDVYPGARGSEKRRSSATFGSIHTVTANFESNDSVDKVCAFYKSKFPNAMVNDLRSEPLHHRLQRPEETWSPSTSKPNGDGSKFQITNVSKEATSSELRSIGPCQMKSQIPCPPPTSHSRCVGAGTKPCASTCRGEVRFDDSSRALYATDGSNYRQVPIGVVLPRDADDVLAAISLCREFGAPLLCRGGGTSLAGQCCNVAVVLDFSKYMAKILEIDPARRIARVQPGVVLDHLRNAAEKHHLTFAPDPATHDRCTLGGMIGNNSCGVHSVMAGKTDDNIEATRCRHLRRHAPESRQELPARSCGNSRPRLSRRPGSIGPQRLRTSRSNLRLAEANRRPIRRPDPPEIPQHPAPRLRIQPELPAPGKRISHRPRSRRLRRNLRHGPRSHLPPGRKPSAARAAGRRLSRHLSMRRPRPRNHGAQAHRPRRLRRSPRLLHAHERHQFRRTRAAPRRRRMAAWSSSAARRCRKPNPRRAV